MNCRFHIDKFKFFKYKKQLLQGFLDDYIIIVFRFLWFKLYIKHTFPAWTYLYFDNDTSNNRLKNIIVSIIQDPITCDKFLKLHKDDMLMNYRLYDDGTYKIYLVVKNVWLFYHDFGKFINRYIAFDDKIRGYFPNIPIYRKW